MSYEVSIIADSISPAGVRITTMQLRFPRFLLAQFNTHRAFSRNARSSRACPVSRLISEAMSDPVIPIGWGRNGRGMQPSSELDAAVADAARAHWLDARDDAVDRARELTELGLHKQWPNRLLEPFLWADVVVTATDWANFFALRCDEGSQPEMQKLAAMMARAYRDGVPAPALSAVHAWWHLPYVSEAERKSRPISEGLKLSVARCARVSYKAFDGSDPDPDADLALCEKLAADGHLSPFEHQARAEDGPGRSRCTGNFRGWRQYRQTLPCPSIDAFDFATLDQFEGRDFVLPEAKGVTP